MAKKASSAANEPENTENDVETVDQDANGQGLIPGTEIKVIKPIIELVKRHEDTKADHKMLTKKLESENEEAFRLFNKHKDHFTESENGNWLYEAGGARLEITRPGEMKVKTKLIDEDE